MTKSCEPRSAAGGLPQRGRYIIAILAILAGMWGGWVNTLQKRVKGVRNEVALMEREWASVSKYSQEAQSSQARLDLVLNGPKRLVNELAKKGWTAGLRSVAASMEPGIELQDISASSTLAEPKGCIVRLRGRSLGGAPRTAADHFRQRLQRELERQFPGVVTTSFHRLEDEPPSPLAGSETQSAVFEIAATVGAFDRLDSEAQ